MRDAQTVVERQLVRRLPVVLTHTVAVVDEVLRELIDLRIRRKMPSAAFAKPNPESIGLLLSLLKFNWFWKSSVPALFLVLRL
jgi:hypothetical protein